MSDGVTDGPGDPVTVDVATVTARFGAARHEAGVPADPGRCERFARAVSVMRPGTLRELHAGGLATLVSGPAQIEIGVQRPLRRPGPGPRRGRADHFRRLGDR
ncbi:MAG TPA: hypothetical protein VN847_03945 [Streptosporangiaceae bacterium]|nr:hypothetical protein [Streptosporangiaceae bacterium]